MLCPICKKPVDEADDTHTPRYYPFCSERCKLIDLGRWLGEKYQIPAHQDDDEREAFPPPRHRGDELQ